MNKNDILSGSGFYWLGIGFLFLAVFAFIFARTFRHESTYRPLPPIIIPDSAVSIDGEGTIYEQTNFQQAQENYQRSYLNLVNKINETDTSTIDVNTSRRLFDEYELQQRLYRDTRRKIDDYQSKFRNQCFARMRSLIQAVLIFDRQRKVRMSRLDYEAMLRLGVIENIPECPQGGKYSIISRGGRRFFHCTVHGTLRN